MSRSHIPFLKMQRVGPPTDHEAELARAAERAREARDVMFAAIRAYAGTLKLLRENYPNDLYLTNPDQVIQDICGVLTGCGVPFDGRDAISQSRGMQ